MLRIQCDEKMDERLTIRLEGRVIGPWVNELRRTCEECFSTGTKLCLDLSEVLFLDRDGVELLRSLRERDVRFLNCSRFVAEQLRA
ncbi:MAG TPA: hypothetical protein VLT62_17270 [Candidatus Methylomirabilis sp.]|nr:hypothetical protein [Candidatus Methylomirabilis sp.]